jgi:hypothetical protein
MFLSPLVVPSPIPFAIDIGFITASAFLYILENVSLLADASCTVEYCGSEVGILPVFSAFN